MVAFGACATMGGIPGLANEATAQEIKDLVYRHNPSLDNPDGVYPQEHYEVPEGELELPHLYDTVKTLDQCVDVDYFMPGCPPEAHQIAAVLDVVTAALKGEGELPPKGAVIGVSPKTCCDECDRVKEEKKISGFKRIAIDPRAREVPARAGLPLHGPGDAGGCGGRCTASTCPAAAATAPPEGVVDQGAKMLSTLARSSTQGPGGDRRDRLDPPRPVGYFYRFGLAGSLLRRAKV
jgi:F420-non-reducing hydrogenase small subunit